MSIHAPNPQPLPGKAGSPFLGFLILAAISLAILAAGLVLGTEPRLVIERSGDGTFRVHFGNYFAGQRFYSRSIEGVNSVRRDDAVREGRRDSVEERRRRSKRVHLEFAGANNSQLTWGRESDLPVVEQFMRGKEPSLSLEEKPPGWRMALSWFCVGLGVLTFIGAVQNSFFPKKKGVEGKG